MTDAEPATRPIRTALAHTDGEALLRQTPEVRAGAQQHEVLRLASALLVMGIRRLIGVVGLRILELGIVLGESVEHLLGAMYAPDSVLPPLHGHHRSRVEFADVDLDRRAQRLGPCTRLPRSDEWRD